MGVARVAGTGALEVSPQGLTVEGRIAGTPGVPRVALFAAAFVLLMIGALVPGSDRVVLPVLVLGTLGAVFSAWRSEHGRHGSHAVPWAAVEHVALLPADPEVVVIVLSAPLAGTGSAEQVYFAPSNGIEAFVETFRTHAPPVVSSDFESALQESTPPAESE
jgi:hypothetical protein